MKSTVRTPIALAVAVACFATLQGCAAWFDEPKEPEPPEPPQYPQRGMDYGVSHYSPESDVARVESGYQHSVLPAGTKAQYREGWKERSLAMDDSDLADQVVALDKQLSSNHERPTDEAGKDSRDTGSKGEKEAGESQTDPAEGLEGEQRRIVESWQKLCENRLEDMDSDDYNRIQMNRMPERLESQCSEREALGRLK